MAKTTIKIVYGSRISGVEHGHCDVPANTVGEHFAVHRSFLGSDLITNEPHLGKLWVVTHIQSGRCVAEAPTKAAAMHAARMFLALDIDWRAVTKDSVAKLPAATKEQAFAIRRFASAGAIA